MKRLVSAFLAGAMALSLAACGGAASTSTAASASASASGSAAASQSAGSDLDYIKGKGKLVIGYTVYEPMNYTDADGNFTGFDTELATAVCEKLGVEPEFVEINWDTSLSIKAVSLLSSLAQLCAGIFSWNMLWMMCNCSRRLPSAKPSAKPIAKPSSCPSA